MDGWFFRYKKAKPFDIDLLSFIDFEIFEAKEAELKDFIYPASSANYELAGYMIKVYPGGHKSYFL